MFVRVPLRKRALRFGAIRPWVVGFCVLFLGCDKAPSKKGPEKTTAAVSESGAGGSPSRPPEPETEPESDEQLDGQDSRQAADEGNVSPPQFDDSASPEFKKALTTLQSWVADKRGRLHAALVDLETDKWLARVDSSVAVNPASNAKVLTAAAALELLGPAYQFKTELLGSVDASGKCERLVLRGGGAPDLSTADLFRLIRVARGQGLSEVQEIVVDQSRFDENFTPPAFEQQPDEWAPFRAPISALSINENAISLNVVPMGPGEPARIWYDPPGVVVAKGRVETLPKSREDRVSWNLDISQDPQRPASVVGGGVGEKLERRRYARRLEDPRLAGGYALSALLEESGVKVSGKVSLGSVRKEPRIALWYSEPLAELVRALGKDSNNFYAEMLFVALSQADEASGSDAPWSSDRGARAVVDWLQKKKLDVTGLVVKNGSGLFDANKVSAELLVSVLAAMEDNPRVFQDFVSHLAMGATDGTMKKRLRSSDLGQRVRAKTGTLRNVDALTGYIQRPGGASPAAFSVIVTGVRAGHGEVRQQVDKLILEWTKAL